MMKNVLWAGLALLLLSGALAADGPGAKTWVLVNSLNYEDPIGGAVWAAQNNYSYAFALTPAHAQYLADFVKKSESPVFYYESSAPVSAAMGAQMDRIGKGNFRIVRTDAPWRGFASGAKGGFAVLVGRQDGAEAVSVAPLAALESGGLYFTDESGAADELDALRAAGKRVLVYGSIAQSIPEAKRLGADVINTGSRYADNLEVLRRYFGKARSDQIMVVSGHAFEASMARMPVALVGNTEPSPELVDWIRSNPVRRAIVVQGDSDIKNAIDSLKEQTALAVFGALGQGFSGNAQVQPLAVMKIPGPEVLMTLDETLYFAPQKMFSVNIQNVGASLGYVLVAVALPDGRASSSQVLPIPPHQSRQFSIGLDASRFASAGKIDYATVQVAAGSQAAMMESIYSLNVSNIEVRAPAPSAGAKAQPATAAPAPRFMRPDSALMDWASALILAFVALFMLSAILRPTAGTDKKGSKKKRMRG